MWKYLHISSHHMTSTCHSKPCHMSNKSASSSTPLLSSSSPSLTLNELSCGEFELLEMSSFSFYLTAGSCWNECLYLKTKKYSPQMSLKSPFDCPQYNYPVYLYHLLSSQASVLLFFICTLLLHLFQRCHLPLHLLQTTHGWFLPPFV